MIFVDFGLVRSVSQRLKKPFARAGIEPRLGVVATSYVIVVGMVENPAPTL
jgi:hypothetical protein